MFWKERIGDELYVYYNGQLIYERWLSKNYGQVFCRGGYSFTARDIYANNPHSVDDRKPR